MTEYSADAPEISAPQQRAIKVANEYHAAFSQDMDAALPILAGLLQDLGERAHIRPPLHVDYGSFAGAVVTKDMPANVVAVGNPAQVVRSIQS